MTERVCANCGKSNPSSASFCSACDDFLGWTQVIDLPKADSEPGKESTSTDHSAAGAPHPQSAPAEAPAVSLDTSEVVVAADAPGTFEINLKNDSTIVDSYLISAVEPPSWLTVAHGDTNLYPNDVRKVSITLAMHPGTLVVAQRLTVSLHVRSSVDTSKYAEISVDVVVPSSGPPATMLARPSLIRLEDSSEGTFSLHLDNQLANFPRRYRMSATDAEGAVVFDFMPPTVEVPAGGTSDTTVRFAARQPPPGQELTRQLMITAAAEDGVVEAQVVLAQSTSPEPERVPVRLRLKPSQVTAVDSPNATVDLVVDNTAGREEARITLGGRDPANLISFLFDRTSLTVPPGGDSVVRVLLGSAVPARGQSVARSFTIVANDGHPPEVEVSGTFELTSRPAAISSASVRLLPQHLVVASRRGTFAVELDNRYGLEPLQVRLSGADEFGQARISFAPAMLTVPQGQVGSATAAIEHPKPAGGSSSSRRVRVVATSGTDSISGEAVFTQEVPSHRRLWAILLVLLGALLTTLGVVVFAADPALSGINGAVRSVVDGAQNSTNPGEAPIRKVVAAAALAFVLLYVVVMLFGLVGRTGKSIRIAAVLAALAAVAATVSVSVVAGLLLMLAGALLAFVGGILLRPATGPA